MTVPDTDSRVYVHCILVETSERKQHRGMECYGYVNQCLGDGTYRVETDDGESISLTADCFSLVHEDILPMYGWLWSFKDAYDIQWIEEFNGVRVMSGCGFRVYRHKDWGYFFGIDGVGYDFYEAHWIPAYRVRFSVVDI